jgi:hypothetical protein
MSTVLVKSNPDIEARLAASSVSDLKNRSPPWTCSIPSSRKREP